MVGKSTGPKERGQGSLHGKGDREEGEEKERKLAPRDKEEAGRRREGATKLSGLYSIEPLGEGQPNPRLESSELGVGYTR